MSPLKYHSGQLAIQTEASTLLVAEQLARWVGPVGEFASGADLILLAAAETDSTLSFRVLSGAPPLVEPLKGPNGLRLRFPYDLIAPPAASTADSLSALQMRAGPALTESWFEATKAQSWSLRKLLHFAKNISRPASRWMTSRIRVR
jgi:hypothetical protein